MRTSSDSQIDDHFSSFTSSLEITFGLMTAANFVSVVWAHKSLVYGIRLMAFSYDGWWFAVGIDIVTVAVVVVFVVVVVAIIIIIIIITAAAVQANTIHCICNWCGHRAHISSNTIQYTNLPTLLSSRRAFFCSSARRARLHLALAHPWQPLL